MKLLLANHGVEEVLWTKLRRGRSKYIDWLPEDVRRPVTGAFLNIGADETFRRAFSAKHGWGLNSPVIK